MAEYERLRDEFAAREVLLAALSVDAPPRSEAVRAQLRLSFPILCDPSREVVRAWDVYNPDEKGGIAEPATFVLERDRRVLYATVDSTAKRVLAPDVLAFLDGAGAPERHRIRPGLGEWVQVTANVMRRGLRQR